jgi:hypothetical protein
MMATKEHYVEFRLTIRGDGSPRHLQVSEINFEFLLCLLGSFQRFCSDAAGGSKQKSHSLD